jgi:hypothetical protein
MSEEKQFQREIEKAERNLSEKDWDNSSKSNGCFDFVFSP